MSAASRVPNLLFRDFSPPCLMLRLLFLAASFTPSLIPQGPIFPGVHGGLLDAFVTVVDESYEAAQNRFKNAPAAPKDPRSTRSAVTLIDWGALGEPTRNTITSGPDSAAITAFAGRDAREPIRVYLVRSNAPNVQTRADLALAERIRVGAFEREFLIVMSPTGIGWMDPASHGPVDYMHGGDIATVAAQYSCLQSPLALIFETYAGLEQATLLLETVHEYWKTLPKDDRPRLCMHRLSLGSWSSIFATNLSRQFDDPIHGAFWAGPPFPSAFCKCVQRARVAGGRWVAPTIGDGSLVL